MAESPDVRLIPSIGQQFVALTDQFLIDQLGRQYTVPELAQFAESVVSTLVASAFTNFREVIGKEGSEAWLKRTLGLCTANIRLMGADALVKFDIEVKDMPNALHKQRQATQSEEPESQEEQPEEKGKPAIPKTKCECRMGSDGICFPCVRTLSGIYKGTFQFMRQMADSAKKNEVMCQVCRKTQTDRALASVVPDALAIKVSDERKAAFRHEIQVMLQQLAGANGATSMPLTEQAWKEAVEA